jgi:hypothetical protein
MLPTFGRVFVTETLTEGTSELADEASSRGMERVGALVELSRVGTPASEA